MKKIFVEIFTNIQSYITEIISSLKEREYFAVFLLLFIVPPLILLGLFVLFLGEIIEIIIFPFEYPKYVDSAFYKNFKRKYAFGITWRQEYLFYNYSVKNGLDIEFREDPQRKELYMKKNSCIYVFERYTSFWIKDGVWQASVDEDSDDIEISKYIAEIYGDFELPVKIIVSEKSMGKNILDEARNSKYFYVYKNLHDLKRL